MWFMKKILENLKEKGVVTKAAFESKTDIKPGTDAALRQRTYTSEDFQKVLDEIDFDVEGEKWV